MSLRGLLQEDIEARFVGDAIDSYQTILKHLPDLADDYRRDRPLDFVDLDSLERMLESH